MIGRHFWCGVLENWDSRGMFILQPTRGLPEEKIHGRKFLGDGSWRKFLREVS
jgi:hypothetical protein